MTAAKIITKLKENGNSGIDAQAFWTGFPLRRPLLVKVAPHLSRIVPELLMMPERLLKIVPPFIMVPEFEIVPEFETVPVTVNVTPESIVSNFPASIVRLALIVQVLVPNVQAPPITWHAPLELPTCNSPSVVPAKEERSKRYWLKYDGNTA